MDEQLIFRKAREGEEEGVFALILERMRWMDEVGIRQWNATEYDTVYPLAYYAAHRDSLYVLAGEETGKIVCAAMLFDRDDRWEDPAPAFYIHNFVSVRGAGHPGERFLQLAAEEARRRGKRYLRLDSADDNPALAAYYTARGFRPCGVCEDGLYHGTLRQKEI